MVPIICIVAMLGAFILATPVEAQSRTPEFTFADLEALVTTKQIRSLDELIGVLPAKVRGNPILVYDSKALHVDRVTFATPRIILFNNDASLILAMTKNPGSSEIAAGQDALEVIHFDHKTARYEMINVIFDGVHVPFDAPPSMRLIEKNPPMCLACHGANPRPIFADYNSWPGFYGSFGQLGVAVAGTIEHQELDKFLSTMGALPRYRDLNLASSRSAKGIHLPSTGFGGLFNSAKFTPALAFGAFTEFLMQKQTAQKISQHSDFANFRFVFKFLAQSSCGSARQRVKDVYAAWIGSDPISKTLADAVLAKIEVQIGDDHTRRITELLKFNEASTLVDTRGLINIPYEQIVRGSPNWVELDKLFFQQQLVLMEAVFQHFKLTNMDVSTTPHEPSSGIFHIRKLGVLKDEPYFELLGDGFVDLDPAFLASGTTCTKLKMDMSSDIKRLAVPVSNVAGVLFY